MTAYIMRMCMNVVDSVEGWGDGMCGMCGMFSGSDGCLYLFNLQSNLKVFVFPRVGNASSFPSTVKLSPLCTFLKVLCYRYRFIVLDVG